MMQIASRCCQRPLQQRSSRSLVKAVQDPTSEQLREYNSSRSYLLSAAVVPACGLLHVAATSPAPAYDTAHSTALKWREIGPFRGGRSVAVAGSTQRPMGVLLRHDRRRSVQDDRRRHDVGADHRQIFRRNDRRDRESASRIPTSFTSAPASRRFAATSRTATASSNPPTPEKRGRYVGLGDTRQIGRIRVNPKNPDIVYVAALGHVWGPNTERGVFKSENGGKSWRKVLFGVIRPARSISSMDASESRRHCTRHSGTRTARRGSSCQADREAESSSPPTAARRGPTSPAIPDCRPE